MKTNHGFTLIELLVVIAIIALLISLLIPVIQAARESSRRVHCGNRMKQVALAVHNYESSLKAFPPGIDCSVTREQTVTEGEGENAIEVTKTVVDTSFYSAWLTLLPFLEKPELYDDIMTQYHARAWDNEIGREAVVSDLSCPSDPHAGRVIKPIGGDRMFAVGGYVMSGGDYCIAVDPDNLDKLGISGFSRGAFQPKKWTTVEEIPDGLSQTVMVSERVIAADDVQLIRGAVVMDRGFSTNQFNACEVPGFSSALCWKTRKDKYRYHDGLTLDTERSSRRWIDGQPAFTWFNTILPPNAPSCASGESHWQPAITPPTSFHSGGVNTALCDGSVKFVSDKVNCGVAKNPKASNDSLLCKRTGQSNFGIWGAMGTRNGNEAIKLP